MSQTVLKFNRTALMFRDVMLGKDFGKQLKSNAFNLNQLLLIDEYGQSCLGLMFLALRFLFKQLVLARGHHSARSDIHRKQALP